MRYVLLFLFTLIAMFASAQVQFLGSPTTTVRNRGNFVSDSLFYLPKRTKAPSDTGAIRYQISDSALYVWTGSAWRTAGTAGSAITGSGVAGYMPEFTTATNIDTTRLYHSNGRFAIGSTTTTNGVFNVIGGTTYLEGNLSFGAADRTISNISNNILAFGTNNTERIRIFANGRVGINTTTDAGYQFDVNGIARTTGSTFVGTSNGYLAVNTTGTPAFTSYRINAVGQGTGDAYISMLNGAGGGYSIGTMNGAGMQIYTQTGSVGSESPTKRMEISSSGDVAIGSGAASGARLDVDGRIRARTIDSSASPINMLWADNNGVIRKAPLASGGITGSGTTNYIPKFTGTQTLGNSVAFDNGGTELLLNTIADSGAYTLQVNGSIYSRGDLIFAGADRTINNISNNYLAFATNNTENMRINASGSILLGQTSSTGERLQVTGSLKTTGNNFLGTVGGRVVVNSTTLPGSETTRISAVGTSTQDAYIQMTNGGGGGFSMGSLNGAGMQFYTFTGAQGSESATKRLEIDASGNVGIGTTSPSERLVVNGNILTSAPSGGTAKPFKIGEAATVSPTSPNRTIRVEIDGTVYYIHAKTTND